ncbi:hypothetical protein [Chordicoccus furentiruminis]|uniref:hypothetical protein n=1 Tax=Chordicoccus furentiruminis TaxID=2709410 RepID=UPI0023A8FAEB|nr:hypothetical protein [Chordicoccus furentiruminis]
MLKRDKILLGVTIGVAALDAGLASSTYLKKKGIVLRDMILASLDGKLHEKNDGDGKVVRIPIE